MRATLDHMLMKITISDKLTKHNWKTRDTNIFADVDSIPMIQKRFGAYRTQINFQLLKNGIDGKDNFYFFFKKDEILIEIFQQKKFTTYYIWISHIISDYFRETRHTIFLDFDSTEGNPSQIFSGIAWYHSILFCILSHRFSIFWDFYSKNVEVFEKKVV